MLITKELLQAYNGIIQEEDIEHTELIKIYIGTATNIISNYVGFDCNIVTQNPDTYTDDDIAMFKNVCLRIATLLQLENGGNIGVANNSDIGINRTFANIVDFTPYLKPLSVYRKIMGI